MTGIHFNDLVAHCHISFSSYLVRMWYDVHCLVLYVLVFKSLFVFFCLFTRCCLSFFLTKNVSCVFLITFLSKLNKNFKTLSTISISFTSVDLLILQCRCTRFHCFRIKCDTLLLSVVHEPWLIEAPVIFSAQSISW